MRFGLWCLLLPLSLTGLPVYYVMVYVGMLMAYVIFVGFCVLYRCFDVYCGKEWLLLIGKENEDEY